MIYISGKINGDPNYKEKFAKAKQMVAERTDRPAATIINPAEMILPEQCVYNDYLSLCLKLIDRCDIVYMIDDWKTSKGACIEYGYAFAKGKEIRSMDDISAGLIAEVEKQMEKKKFRLEDYKDDNYVMHCNTKEKAKVFSEFLHEQDKKWHYGNLYTEDTHWGVYRESTCYNFNSGTYQNTEYFEKEYTILEFDDFDWSEGE